jgi:hypothetical protein
METDENVGAVVIGHRRALFNVKPVVSSPGQIHGVVWTESVPDLFGHDKGDVLFGQAGRPNGAGVMAAVCRIQHNDLAPRKVV